MQGFSITRRLLGFISGGLALALAATAFFAWLQSDRLSSERELSKARGETIVALEDRIKADAGKIAERDRLIGIQNTAVLALQQADQANREAYQARIAAAETKAQSYRAQAADIMNRQADTQDELERSREALKLIQEVVGKQEYPSMTDKLNRYAELYKAEGNSIDFDCEDYGVIDEGDWEQDHKYQHASHIVRFEGDYFQVNESRSGSYHTDWYYGDTMIVPVDRVEETKVVVSWKANGPHVDVAGDI